MTVTAVSLCVIFLQFSRRGLERKHIYHIDRILNIISIKSHIENTTTWAVQKTNGVEEGWDAMTSDCYHTKILRIFRTAASHVVMPFAVSFVGECHGYVFVYMWVDWVCICIYVCIWVCVCLYGLCGVCGKWSCVCPPGPQFSYRRQPQSKCSRLCFFIIDAGRQCGQWRW